MKAKLGCGVTSDVYLGKDKLTGVHVALKIFNEDQDTEYINSEIETLKKLDH